MILVQAGLASTIRLLACHELRGGLVSSCFQSIRVLTDTADSWFEVGSVSRVGDAGRSLGVTLEELRVYRIQCRLIVDEEVDDVVTISRRELIEARASLPELSQLQETLFKLLVVAALRLLALFEDFFPCSLDAVSKKVVELIFYRYRVRLLDSDLARGLLRFGYRNFKFADGFGIVTFQSLDVLDDLTLNL